MTSTLRKRHRWIYRRGRSAVCIHCGANRRSSTRGAWQYRWSDKEAASAWSTTNPPCIELTVAEVVAKAEPKDHLAELFDLLERVGATVTLYGKPVTQDELRAHALANVAERIARKP